MSTSQTFTEQDWNRLRTAFSVSIMADTPISALAQNVELPEWPIAGEDERPSKYLDYSWDQLQALPVFQSDPELLPRFLDVLRDTLAFDEPFQEMVEQSEKASATDFAALRTLRKLGIPEEFPIDLTSLSREAKDFCRSQNLRTLGEYTSMSQRISQFIIMEGDFRHFLNALSHLNEAVIARYVPYRVGHRGLHLAEAVGHLLTTLPEPERLALARAANVRLSKEQASQADAVTRERLAEVETEIRQRLLDLISWFKDDARDWQTQTTGVHTLEYRLRVLNDPLLEAVALRVTRAYFQSTAAAAAATPAAAGTPGDAASPAPSSSAASPRRGLFARLASIFGGRR